MHAQNPTRRLYCVEWHNTVFAWSGPLFVHKLLTSRIRPRMRTTWFATHDDNFHQVWTLKLMTISRRVTALLVRIRYVTLWPWPLTLYIGYTWWITCSTPPPSLKILYLSVLELWRMTSTKSFHWQCVCSHFACAVSHDLCVGSKFSPYIWNSCPRLIYITL